jgi:hypothetical protein
MPFGRRVTQNDSDLIAHNKNTIASPLPFGRLLFHDATFFLFKVDDEFFVSPMPFGGRVI